jgi:hypothetical protein
MVPNRLYHKSHFNKKLHSHLHIHCWVMVYLTDGFKTLAPFSIDTQEAGSTCNASSMQPDDDLQDSRGIR